MRRINEMIILPMQFGQDMIKALTERLRELANAVNNLLTGEVVVDGNLTINGTVTIPSPFTLGSTSVTASGTELNILDGVTATTAELNILDGVTSTTTELNLLDGITALAAGTYTPTVADVANTYNLDVSVCQYLRINDVVTVSGKVSGNATDPTTSTITLTLPVASTFTDDAQVAGVGRVLQPGGSPTTVAAKCFSANGGTVARLEWSASAAGQTFENYFHFTYQIDDGTAYNGLQVEVLFAEENVDGITADRTFYFPTTNWGYYVSFMGPLEAGEEVTFTLGGSPKANISITQVFDRFGDGFDQTAVVEINVDEYDADMIGETFTVYAQTTISGITTATLSFEGVAAPVTPYESAWWGTKYGWSANYHTSAGPPYASTFEYPQYAASGDFHRIYFLTGYVWEDVGNISWVITQTAGTTRSLYVAHDYAYSWKVTRDLATDYAGTAYSLQMQYDGVDFGDPVVLTCDT